MMYCLTEDEFRALKVAGDVKMEDYRDRLIKAVFEELKPRLYDNYFFADESHPILIRLREVFLSVPVMPSENKV